MILLKKTLKLGILAIIITFLGNANLVNANVLFSQLDDSVQLIGNSFVDGSNTFTDATGYPTEVRISYNDGGNGPGHFILVGIVDADIGVTYYGYNPAVSTICGNTFESTGLNTKQILTFNTNWEWRSSSCTGSNLTFDPTHHYYLLSSRNTGGFNTQVYYGSSSDPSSYYCYVENSTNFHDSQKSITSFGFPDLAEGVVDETNRTVTLHIPFSTDISALALTSQSLMEHQ